ncbi:MAG: Asp23/Gls24 family envelope stress response protein, partial [Chloroflexota bacterium]
MAEEKRHEHGFVGETIIGDEVVASIAGMAAQEVEGVGSLGRSTVRRAFSGAFADAAERARAGVAVEVGKRECIVDLQINVHYGYSIPNIINEVRKKVAARLLEFTGLIAKEINIRVVGIDVP